LASGITPEDAVPNAATSGDGKCIQRSARNQGVVNADLLPMVVAQSVLVDGLLSGVPESARVDIASIYQQHGLVVNGLED
jgi:hypothetical protein